MVRSSFQALITYFKIFSASLPRFSGKYDAAIPPRVSCNRQHLHSNRMHMQKRKTDSGKARGVLLPSFSAKTTQQTAAGPAVSMMKSRASEHVSRSSSYDNFIGMEGDTSSFLSVSIYIYLYREKKGCI